MSNSYIQRVADAALNDFDAAMGWLSLSGGKVQGREYLPLNPNRADTKPGSFSINRDSGAWSDFATGDSGGDLVSLAAYVWGLGQFDAAKQLGEKLGIFPDEKPRQGNRPNPQPKSKPTAPKQQDSDLCVMPVPDDAPPPPDAHYKNGKPSSRWAYRSESGAVMFYHCRFDPKKTGERKQFAPLTLWKIKGQPMSWRWKAPPAPRPAYGLDELKNRPDAPVCIVEGEKAADAAASLLPGCVVMCWQGGCQALAKTDWQPLKGREVWLWPDNDDPGKLAMRKLAGLLKAACVGRVRWIDLKPLAKKPGFDGSGAVRFEPGQPLKRGDDAADLLGIGWTAKHMAALIDGGGLLLDKLPGSNPPSSGAKQAKTPDSGVPARKHFVCDEDGVFVIDVRNGDYLPRRWICSPLKVIARVRTPENSGWSLLVSFDDPDGVNHREILPMELFRAEGTELTGLLLGFGLTIAPKARAQLVEYLQTQKASKRARMTQRIGWHGYIYVLQDAAFGSDSEEWIFQNDGPRSNTFKQKGTLADWQSTVAALCAGNSRLLFAVSMAFAAPVLHLIGGESGGFHLRSNSSDGKTTVLRVAASVCGGVDYMQRWRATDNGLESMAVQHCDAPLLLDELAQLEARVAGECAYMLGNGSGKARSGRYGGLRERAFWRVLFLSAGEVGLAQHMGEAGKSPRAGQSVRLAEIPADAGAGLGVFENLHDIPNGSEFAQTLGHAVRLNYGTPWAAFLQAIIEHLEDIPDIIEASIKGFEREYLSDEASGQARRVAARFGLVGAAGELATAWGITGCDKGQALWAASVCFKAWLDGRGGEGDQEAQAMLSQVRGFLELHGEGRFSDVNRTAVDDDHAPRVLNRAGFRQLFIDGEGVPFDDELSRDYQKEKQKGDENKESVEKHQEKKTEFFILPEVFRKEVCKGYDHRAVVRLLIDKKYARNDKGRLDRKVSLPGMGRVRVYHVLPELFDDGAE